jgi:peptide/nickel transport system substrate-binding protein
MGQEYRPMLRVSIFIVFACVSIFSLALMPISPVLAGTPVSVNKLTVAMDGWGSDMIDPWEYPQGSFIQSYLNLRLVTRDENMQIQPLWAVEWSQNEQGIDITLHPKAVCQNGEQADAELLKANLRGTMGLIEGFRGGLYAGRFKGSLDSFEVRGERHLFLKTKTPDPGVFPLLGGHNYNQIWYGPAQYLLKVGHEGFVKKPVGCGPYKIREYMPGDRVVFERWEEFWSDYPYWPKPQHKTMEWLKVPDGAARYALLKSRQVEMAINIPYPIAKDLPRSEETKRGVNPGKGGIWTQTLKANGKMQIAFDLEMALKEGKADPAQWGNDPTLNPKVREALALAIDTQAILNSGYGFLLPNESIYSLGSFGWRKERAEQRAVYDPERARKLLAEAGYPNGFETTAHFAEFAGRPNQREAMDIIASNWKAIGVAVKVVEHDPFKYYADQDAGKRAYLPINEWTWGRQENGIFLAQIGYSSSGFRSLYNERTDALVQELSKTLDERKQLELLGAIEEEVFRNRWIVPLYDASAVYGYSDRVAQHLMPEFGAHFLDLNRILLKD